MNYIEAHQLASSLLKAGEIKAFACGHNHDIGRYIDIETEEGWHPAPLWQEDEQPEDPARYL